MRSARRAILSTAALLGAAALLAGCASGPTGGADDAASAGEGFPVRIENSFGTTEIPAKPERVASIAWGNHDVAIALGVVPVGMAFSTYADDNGDGVLPWTYDALEELGAVGDDLPVLFDEVDGIDFEAVAETEPDLVLGAFSGLTEEDYDTLSEIAPTVSWPTAPFGTDWRETTLIDAEALGLEDEAQAKIDEVDALIDDTMAQYPDVVGKTVAYTWMDPSDTSQFYVYTPLDSRAAFMTDLGMEHAPSVVELGSEDESAFFVTLSAENADVLADADIIVSYGDADTLTTLQADPLIGAIPAIQRGSVVMIDDSTSLASATSSPTVLSIPWAIEDYAAAFGDAAAKVQ
ncbi:iron complex transport system substrate-binding protein [Diaminobutyricimonas aerilata]|uniref:Iron complex transport system substrate-binding protein n=1 Tax=Diaminobutyricimonas aerilata TaxID=1162967 RepID=A0A2M9CGN6_9MICO|nr:iron-siderophore ABC transporter substrate-binding protein [Diaminobutyricimonas aerilata]PJJ71038.1 iron complex transport system substrate-binding protein [Diaminobutyricimonas aerilata]